jgi:hypothetical protein
VKIRQKKNTTKLDSKSKYASADGDMQSIIPLKKCSLITYLDIDKPYKFDYAPSRQERTASQADTRARIMPAAKQSSSPSPSRKVKAATALAHTPRAHTTAWGGGGPPTACLLSPVSNGEIVTKENGAIGVDSMSCAYLTFVHS